MYEAALSIIEERLKNLPELQSLVHPDVRRLQQINRQGDSQYVRTLLEYLICGGNYTDTAQRLGLHRNSLIYRMTRIQEIIHCNLEDFQTRKVLLFSLLIAGNTND
nr:helix-turn-helix domain-containing protein [Flavonifractor plautii]